MALTHLSLFSGIGGLDLAAEWAGIQTVGQCEFADYPNKILSKHWPDVPKWRDIRTLTGDSFYEKTGMRTVSVISGGFPCQPFSVAGKRRGREDDRYLWPEMLRVIAELKPTWVIGENVAGLASMAEPLGVATVESRAINRFPNEDYYEVVLSQQERMLLAGILEDIGRIGYEVQPFIIPACGVGALHRRERIFLIAHACGIGCSTGERDRKGRHVPHDGERNAAEGQQKRDGRINRSGEVGADVADTKRVRLREDSDKPAHDEERHNSSCREEREAELCETGCGRGNVPNSNCQKCQQPVEHNNTPGGAGLTDGSAATPDANNATTARHRKHSGKVHAEPELKGFSCSSGADWWSTEPDVGRVAHGIPNRVDRLKCLGNAVVPQQAYPIFKAIAEIDGK